MRRLLLFVLLAGLLLVPTASSASAATTRAEYIALVEPICKEADGDISRALRGWVTNIKKGNLPKAGRKVGRANRIFERSIDSVERILPPAEDAAVIASWLALERRDVRLGNRISSALKSRNARRAVKFLDKSFKLEKTINAVIGDYGFKECN